MNKKVLLLLTNDTKGISTYPAVYQSACEFKKRAFRVTILTGAIMDDRSIANNFDKYHIINFKKNIFHFIYNNLYCFLYIVMNSFDYVLAYEPDDAATVSLSSIFLKNTNFIYYNIEIKYIRWNKYLIRRILRRIVSTLKKFPERVYVKNATCLIIQDEIRKELFEKDCPKHIRTYLIPNSYYNNYQYNLIDKQGKSKVIFCGALEKWSIHDIIQDQSILKHVKLTLSGYSRDGYSSEIREILKIYSNIKIMDSLLSINKYFQLINKHDIGLVWYSIEPEDIKKIGRSSGKFFAYLSCGKPVIVKNLCGMADDVRKYKLGLVVDRTSELPEAVRQIMSNYKFYSSNVIKTYGEIFDYALASKAFFDSLN